MNTSETVKSQVNASLPKAQLPPNSTSHEPFDMHMRPVDSIPANKWHRNLMIQNEIQFQKTPYSPPTQISKGLTSTTAGGSFTLYDKTGGTAIFTYSPTTGVVTINGSLIAQNSNTGTYTNITLGGSIILTGTIINGLIGTSLIQGGTIANAVIGTPNLQAGTIGTALHQGGTIANATIGTSLFTGGTINPALYQTGGTAGIGTTIVYVKSVNFVGSTTTVGTLIFNNGILISSQ